MTRIVQILGFLLMAIGGLVILTWLIKPLRELWPIVFDVFRSWPMAVQVGLIIAAVGFLILISSLIWERIEDRKKEGDLLDNDD